MKKIICPNCGAEYLPVEIFIPQSFFGNIKTVERDENGKITEFLGDNMDVNESYRCDYCSKKFSIETSIDFKTSVNSPSIDSTYSTKLNTKTNLFLDEE